MDGTFSAIPVGSLYYSFTDISPGILGALEARFGETKAYYFASKHLDNRRVVQMTPDEWELLDKAAALTNEEFRDQYMLTWRPTGDTFKADTAPGSDSAPG